MICKLQEEVVEINTQRLKIKEAELLWSTDNKLHLQRISQVRGMQTKLEEYCRLLKKIKDLANKELDRFVATWTVSGLAPLFS